MESQYCPQHQQTVGQEGFGCCQSYLVYHHNSQQVTEGGEEQTVQVVLRFYADRPAKSVEHDLSDDERENAEEDMQ